jgi:SAM-dependent methyltransferase
VSDLTKVDKPGYIPQWRNGHEVGTGLRDANSRYIAIRDYLYKHTYPWVKKWKPENAIDGPAVLDVGAFNGYFSRRLVDDFNARCVAVDNNPLLREPYKNITVVGFHLEPPGIRALGHFDVVLALSVLHHYPNWPDYLAALLDAGDLLFIETPSIQERLGPRITNIHQRLSAMGELLARTPSMAKTGDRFLWAVEGTNSRTGRHCS